jgi:hypothetical protein
MEDRDLIDTSYASSTASQVYDDVEAGPQLAVDRFARQPGGHPERFEPGRHVRGGIGVHRPTPALVPRVEGGEQIDYLGSADLADHQPIGPHPQRLPDQVAHRHQACPLDVGRPGLEAHNVRMIGPELRGVLDDDEALARVDDRQQRRQQRGLA